MEIYHARTEYEQERASPEGTEHKKNWRTDGRMSDATDSRDRKQHNVRSEVTRPRRRAVNEERYVIVEMRHLEVRGTKLGNLQGFQIVQYYTPENDSRVALRRTLTTHAQYNCGN